MNSDGESVYTKEIQSGGLNDYTSGIKSFSSTTTVYVGVGGMGKGTTVTTWDNEQSSVSGGYNC